MQGFVAPTYVVSLFLTKEKASCIRTVEAQGSMVLICFVSSLLPQEVNGPWNLQWIRLDLIRLYVTNTTWVIIYVVRQNAVLTAAISVFCKQARRDIGNRIKLLVLLLIMSPPELDETQNPPYFGKIQFHTKQFKESLTFSSFETTLKNSQCFDTKKGWLDHSRPRPQTRLYLNHNEEGDVDIKWQAYKAKTVLHYRSKH